MLVPPPHTQILLATFLSGEMNHKKENCIAHAWPHCGEHLGFSRGWGWDLEEINFPACMDGRWRLGETSGKVFQGLLVREARKTRGSIKGYSELTGVSECLVTEGESTLVGREGNLGVRQGSRWYLERCGGLPSGTVQDRLEPMVTPGLESGWVLGAEKRKESKEEESQL